MRVFGYLFIRIILFCILIGFNSCQSKKATIPPPNIVWIVSEDNSKHYLKLFDKNGVATPNIESLAENGLVFTHTFSNGAVCSVARSAIISGCYGPRIGSQFHRKYKPVPMPDSLKMFPYYLREAGYYTTNNSKKDYNILEDKDIWDESSKKASWRNRKASQLFFHVQNIHLTHESSVHFTKEFMDFVPTKTSLNTDVVQPNHPNTKTFRYTNALYRDKIIAMDQKVGEVIKQLEQDELMDNTFIFYYGDHGGVLPGSKGYLYETGVHVPLVVHVPKNYKYLVKDLKAQSISGFVSFVDLAPTVLNLVGVEIPNGMDGKPFLGAGVSNKVLEKRNVAFSYADRFDEKYDLVRAVRKGKMKYIRNYIPCNYDGLMNNYRYKQLAYSEWLELFKSNKLNNDQSAFFQEREPELLFNIKEDPYETKNLANDPRFEGELLELRAELTNWVKEMPDLSFYPEHELIQNAFNNPTEFGQLNRDNISRYIDIADLSLFEFNEVKDRLKKSLESQDPWERYWALITSVTFGDEAKSLENIVVKISEHDSESANRVRAAEFLIFVMKQDASHLMIQSLYDCNDPMEALLILNSIALQYSTRQTINFDIEFGRLSNSVKTNNLVKERLKYLGVH